MKKFTEGPWKIGTPGPNGCLTIGTERGLMTAMIAHSINEPSQESQARGDAALIARSPSMYEALERILFRCNSFLDDDRDMSQDSIAAIAMICTQELKKARGEQ